MADASIDISGIYLGTCSECGGLGGFVPGAGSTCPHCEATEESIVRDPTIKSEDILAGKCPELDDIPLTFACPANDE